MSNPMKRLLSDVYLAICILSTFQVSNGGDSKSMFLEEVNSHWVQREYSSILSLATTKAEANESILEAHAVLISYHLFISGDKQLTLNAIDDLIAILRSSSNSGLDGIIDLRNEISELPVSNSNPPTGLQFDELHRIYPDEFPTRIILSLITR